MKNDTGDWVLYYEGTEHPLQDLDLVLGMMGDFGWEMCGNMNVIDTFPSDTENAYARTRTIVFNYIFKRPQPD